MYKKIFAIAAACFLFASEARADDGEVVEIDSNPGDMIRLMSEPTAFTYTPPYIGFLDKGEYTINSKNVDVKNAIDDDLDTFVNITYGKDPITITFDEPQEVVSIYFKVNTFRYVTYLSLYDATGKRVYSKNPSAIIRTNGIKEAFVDIDLKNIKEIIVNPAGGGANHDIYEIEFNVKEPFIPVFDIKAEATDHSVSLQWDLPQHSQFKSVKMDGVDIGQVKNYTVEKLKQSTEYEFNIVALYDDGTEINTVYKATTKKDTTPPGEIMNATIKQTKNNIEISYDLPTDKDFSHIEIYRGMTLYGKNIKDTKFIDEKPIQNSTNNYSIKTVDEEGNKSKGVALKILHTGFDVYNLKATAKDFSNVVLNWSNPQNTAFETATIYRKDPNKGVVARVMSFFSASDGYNPLFETNGTMFKDMTVEADTTYTYKVTTTMAGEESEGVTATVKVPELAVIGGDIAEGEDTKDYVITWDLPTKGQVKVLIGGVIYKTVNAVDQQITIPKEKMLYDFVGKPDVQLIPVDENGGDGVPTKPKGNTNTGGGGFGDITGGNSVNDVLSANNLLKSGVALLGVVGGIVLLVLAFRFAPMLVKMIRDALLIRRNRRT